MDFAVTPSTDSSGATVLVDPSVVMTALSSSGTAIGMRHHTLLSVPAVLIQHADRTLYYRVDQKLLVSMHAGLGIQF